PTWHRRNRMLRRSPEQGRIWPLQLPPILSSWLSPLRTDRYNLRALRTLVNSRHIAPLFVRSRSATRARQAQNGNNELRGNYGDSASRKLTDRKSTRLNSSHQIISYAVFC